MAVQFSVSARNGAADAFETATGTSAVLKLRSGTQPADCAAADSGTVLASMTLPSDWLTAASSGSKSKAGTWEDLTADASGTFGHFRIYASDGTTCHLQGSAGTSGTDMILDSATVTAGQKVTVTAFTVTAGGA